MSSRNYQALLKIRDKMVAGKDIDTELIPQILPIDLLKSEQLENVADKAWSMHGAIDILINNAGRVYTIEDCELYLQAHYKYGSTSIYFSITKDDPAQIRPNIFRPVLGKMAVPYRSTFMDKDTDEGMAPEKFAAAMTEYAINEEKDVVICSLIPRLGIFSKYCIPSLHFWNEPIPEYQLEGFNCSRQVLGEKF
ncbi:uncharacterized protein TRIADDRAFT_52907 [Trichoplax adhaerens]|uniref:Uncharacterized protein n=1 Tax=Trichoplax adhaerens TaxID=10228 RepID=B3RMS6_TRIAD|nr:hypothetical protein TRIADDRAFT_52907 [Trichoplax adhaerens]EDV27327.1 hypothetical protein TRIADDRAFT_52907 [Trichoplax adhaerens]|eukprot:XP_002109161.1 hypothetical protein TRIADDRAFT_52907 [Trichoplax adhaerens]